MIAGADCGGLGTLKARKAFENVSLDTRRRMANIRMLRLRLFRLLVAIALAYAFAMSAAQIATQFRTPRFSRIFAFGDSLSDSGNVYSMTFHLYPAAPYWNGRFSNGPTWVEVLGTKYSLVIKASRSGGTNYAYGGAQTGYGNSSSGTPNADTQISSFTSAVGSFSGNDLVTLWVGANDLINGQTDVSIPTTNIYNECVRLKNLGARYLLVGNVPPLGFTPRFLGTADEAGKNAISQSFNTALHSRMVAFRAAFPTVRVIEFDAYGLFMAVRSDPFGFGLVDVTHSYTATDRTGNPDTYLFWDDLHPTRVTHAFLGSAAYYSLAGLQAARAAGR
jgi:phospholipase/lecithinase/hemolysin